MMRRASCFALVLALAACRRPVDPAQAVAIAVADKPPSWLAVHVEVGPGEAVEQAAMTIERAVMGVPDVVAVRSEIDAPRAVVWLAFDVDDMTNATFAVREALEPALPRLPMGVHPSVSRHDRAHADAWILLRSETLAFDVLADLALELRMQLMQTPGVAQVSTCGPRRRTVVALDDARLAALGLTAGEVLQLLRDEGPELVLRPSAIDVKELRTREYGGVSGDMFMTTFDDRVDACRVVLAGAGNGFALRASYWADDENAQALGDVIAKARTQLPPDVRLQHEPFVDRPDEIAPRVRVRAPSADALVRLALGNEGSWLVIPDAHGSAQLVGLADAKAAAKASAQLRETPGITAVVEDARWTTVAITGVDHARLLELAPRLAEWLARDGTTTPWPELLAARPRPETAIDRERAARAGLGTTELREILELYDEGIDLGAREDARTVDVVVRVGLARPSEPVPSDARVRTRDGAIVPLQTLVDVRETAPERLQRCNGERCVGLAVPATVAAQLDVDAIARALELGPGESVKVLPRTP